MPQISQTMVLVFMSCAPYHQLGRNTIYACLFIGTSRRYVSAGSLCCSFVLYRLIKTFLEVVIIQKIFGPRCRILGQNLIAFRYLLPCFLAVALVFTSFRFTHNMLCSVRILKPGARRSKMAVPLNNRRFLKTHENTLTSIFTNGNISGYIATWENHCCIVGSLPTFALF